VSSWAAVRAHTLTGNRSPSAAAHITETPASDSHSEITNNRFFFLFFLHSCLYLKLLLLLLLWELYEWNRTKWPGWIDRISLIAH